MEYSWGYAVARAPPSTYPLSHSKPDKKRADRPARSNSTSDTTAKRKPRIPGHSRASSCSSTNHSTPEFPPPEVHQQHQRGDAPGGVPSYVASAARGGSQLAAEQRRPLDLSQVQHSQQQPQQRRERVASLGKYYHSKQLPATPHLDCETTTPAPNPLNTAGDSDPARGHSSTRGPRPLSVSFPPQTPTWTTAAATSHYDRRMFNQHAAMFTDSTLAKISGGGVGPSPRADSVVSTTSGATTLSGRTMLSSETPWSAESAAASSSAAATTSQPKPLVVRNGRTYLSDPTLIYPLPVDLAELHRQSLRMLLLFRLFGGPVCCPDFANKPPLRVLEVGCGSGFWSMMCHRYFSRLGHSDISFTGMDIAPIAPGAPGQASGSTSTSTRNSASTGGRGGARTSAPSSSLPDGRPDKDMKWRFVQHDLRKFPWPFPDGEFDLVMVKDMSLAMPCPLQQALMDEHLRLLRPGGTLEIWESDLTIRMLRPHVPEGRQPRQSTGQGETSGTDAGESSGDSSGSEEDEHEAAANLGAYVMTSNTPMSAPLNNFLVEYNTWVSRALEARGHSALPCTLIGPLLLQEAEILTATGSRRLAVPLSEARWEREGVGGVVTKDGKSYIETKGKGRGSVAARGTREAGRPLTAAQAALRRTALTTVVQQIQSLEGLLREVSGKSQDEWDGWVGKMMNDLMQENGTRWGECLEIGAWWAKKRS